jgi:glutamate-ammonia-ligase adenylyltransferase
MDLLVYGTIKDKKLTMSGISEQLDLELSHIRKTNKTDIENSLNLIRDVYHRNLFLIVVQGIYKELSITEFSDNLSMLTEAILDITFDLALRFTNLENVDHGIGIIAFGKLGTRELDLGSDLDLIFLTKDQETAHKEKTYKVIKKFISWIELRTFSGSLFKIDTALRPNGTSGLLVSSLDAFSSYQKNEAWYWEHQALTKARFLTGDKNIAEKFECIRREVIQLPKNLASLTEEVISMRMLMISKNASKNQYLLADLKNSRGGLIDIEFIVQYIVLAYSSECPDLCMNKGNFFLLKLIGEKNLAPRILVTKVANIFLKYRTLIHENRLKSLDNKLSTKIIENDMKCVVNLWNLVFSNKPKKIRALNQIRSKIK